MPKFSDLVAKIIDAVQDKKGYEIKILDLSSIEGASTGTFVICTGKSTSQVGAIADNVRESLQEKAGIKPYNYDGYRNCEWIVIDYGDIMVHVFLPEMRTRYNLEELWNDAPVTEIENID